MIEMTEKMFFKHLCETVNGWRITKQGYIRRGAYSYCPITAVARKVTGRAYRSHSFAAAAKAIGLYPSFALNIATASDFRAGGLGSMTKALRSRLLAATGLKGDLD